MHARTLFHADLALKRTRPPLPNADGASATPRRGVSQLRGLSALAAPATTKKPEERGSARGRRCVCGDTACAGRDKCFGKVALATFTKLSGKWKQEMKRDLERLAAPLQKHEVVLLGSERVYYLCRQPTRQGTKMCSVQHVLAPQAVEEVTLSKLRRPRINMPRDLPPVSRLSGLHSPRARGIVQTAPREGTRSLHLAQMEQAE